MKQKEQKKVQLFLMLIGVLLIIFTYFYYPYISEKKISDNTLPKSDSEKIADDKQINVFENVEYKGLYDLDKSFVIKSEKAHIKIDEPDIVYMKNMLVILYLDDGRIVNITSNEGRYNKVTHDCFLQKNVEATDGETEIFAENLDMLATNNFVAVYNDVKLNYPTGFLRADKIDYDFETKYFKVSMFSEEKVKMKVVR